MLKSLLDWFNPNENPEQQAISPNLAAAALLVEVMAADDNWKSEEEETIKTLLVDSLTTSSAEADDLMQTAKQQQKNATDLYEMTKQLNSHYSMEQKYKLIFAMWKVAFADGELDRYEDHIIRKVSELLYLPHEQFIHAKLQAKPD
ncbi:TerB family tellurite resistance protein [Ketobacter sp. MCCC 1A13808]|uniref:tellurite resistance TerB family protein n=1 Tax=Ketobacter sp. MCCC 1A13808 TaxID=2602738 RepID=UPI000F111584|nr:TerB family tellurite resistance protein [Ketobacter sp. MCCC 1A13808]MVF11232.1 TerB family tellurite resistance protein [Ketobacter sp. MCCC 1A13808]RLP53637.1 MAG: TerB family tellurite resistance protein [Ketobacter sp.]|tara:strand:- start:823 stop:1260 length:438 start_codon:yes stop_codon:yes gene_type:complete